jgi:uncharacterized protein YjbJ (UPF0337 family)
LQRARAPEDGSFTVTSIRLVLRISLTAGITPPFCLSAPIAFDPNHITTAALMVRDFIIMKSSTKDKIKGGFREAKGKVKEEAGKVTGNPDLHDRGTVEKTGGKVQRKIGDVEKVFGQ